MVRDADGRLRIRGGQPTQGALQISSASLIDPSTGDFDLDLPAQSVESVEVLAEPVCRRVWTLYSPASRRSDPTRHERVGSLARATWCRGSANFLTGIRGFEPRLSVRGPLKKDRVFFAQDVQFRYVATPVKSLPGEPEIDLRSFDSFTRVDGVVSARHTLGGGADPVSAQDQARAR